MKNIIIIGAGGIGIRHIKAYLATNRVTISIVEPDNDKVAVLKMTLKFQKCSIKLKKLNYQSLI